MTFFTQFYILRELKFVIDSFPQLVELIFLCNVTDTFPVNIRLRLLSACLNSAKHHVTIFYLNKMANLALYSSFLFICLLGELYLYVCLCLSDENRINDNCESSRLELLVNVSFCLNKPCFLKLLFTFYIKLMFFKNLSD